MPLAQAETLMSLADKLGVPVTILVVLSISIWRIAHWGAPRVDKVVQAHIDNVRVQTETHREMREALTGIDGNLRTQTKLLEGMEATQSRTAQAVDRAMAVVAEGADKGEP